MKDVLTENIKVLEEKLISAVNESNLPPIVVSMMLTNLLYEVNDARVKLEEKEAAKNEFEVSSGGNSDKQ